MENKIKEVLKEKGVSQKQLCAMVGMSEAGMSNAIKGSATMETIKKVAEALQVEVGDLVDEVLYAKYSADKTPLRLGSVELPCYVLNNGLRVFSGRGIQKALGASNLSGTWLSNFIKSEAISTKLQPEVYERMLKPISFNRKGAGGSQSMTYGYEATLLIDLCSAIIEAYETRTSGVNETYYASANVIIRAVAKVGIIALVDEATGYNQEKSRAKDELQKFLSTFLNQEASKWVKMFDDSFFEDIYKMRNWTWAETTKRPQFVGKIINDIVYERIAPLVLEELKKANPKLEGGNRRYKFHQFLTSEVGKPKLKDHLTSLHTLAIASDFDWARFMLLVDKVHPKQYQQLSLFDDI